MKADKVGRAGQDLVAELNHQINSPLAAIRNALYLASIRTSDPLIRWYLQLADDEIDAIAETLRLARRQSAPSLHVGRAAA